MTRKNRTAPKTFKVDNQWMENTPRLVGIQPRGRPTAKGKEAAIQYYLPGMAPFQPFDEWVAWACYNLLDPKRPTDAVEVSIADFADRLRMGRQAVGQGDWLGFSSDTYEQVHDALMRLYSAEVTIGFNRNGKHYEYRTRVLSGFGFVYADGRQADEFAGHMLENVNTADPERPVWKRKDARPVAVVFRFTQELTEGIRNQGDRHIGATTLPDEVFNLRRDLSPIAMRLLNWVCRQASQQPTISLKRLRSALNIAGRNVKRDRESIEKALQQLKEEGVIESFSLEDDVVTCRKTPAYYYGKTAG